MIRRFVCAALLVVPFVAPACGTDHEEPIPKSVQSGFSLQDSAFSFENFATGYADSQMTTALVARMFGAENVCSNKATPCTLTPTASAWMRKMNGAMNGGRCEGFAVLSSLFFTGALDSNAFGAATPYQLKLKGNLALQEEIAYWFATQSLDVATENTKKLDATAALRFLASFLGNAKNSGEFFRIGMVRKNKKSITGGHALTPIRYEPGPTAGIYYVHVYDNNFPAQDRYITIDTNKNRWEYKAAANPDEKAALYYGDASNKNYLYFAPVKNRVGKLACKFCKAGAGKKYVVVDGADVTAKDKSGGTTGVKGGEINEGSGRVVPGFSAETWSSSAPMTLILDEGETTYEISANADSSTAQGGVAEFGPGYHAEAKNLALGAGTTDSFKVSDKNGNVEYKSTSGTSVALSTAVATASGNVVEIEVRVPAGTTQATAKVDKDTGVVEARTAGAEGQEVTLTVTKVDAATGETQSGTVTAEAGANNTLTAETADWAADKPLEVKQDKGDGTPPVVLKDGCTDGAQNGTETDIDCGGACTTKCGVGKTCKAPLDCTSALCNATRSACVATECEDGVKNGDESAIDCGGSCAAKCAEGKACALPADCASGVCNGATSTCVASACEDGVKSGSESDVDCGGSCTTKCAVGKTCGVGADCVSSLCNATTTACVATACEDGVKSGGEADVDCGGTCATKCASGKACIANADCASGLCTQSRCDLRPTLVWFDATDAATLTIPSGNVVTQWADKSGFNRNAFLTGADVGPVLTPNVTPAGKPGLLFTGVSQRFTTAVVPGTADITIFAAYQFVSPGIWATIAAQSQDQYFSLRIASAGAANGNLNFHIQNNNDAPFIPFATGVSRLVTAIRQGTTSTIAHRGGPTSSFTGNTLTPVNLPYTVGNSASGAEALGGYLSELRVYGSALTPADRTIVENAMAATHGL